MHQLNYNQADGQKPRPCSNGHQSICKTGTAGASLKKLNTALAGRSQ
jgi:hypothetical protein